MQRRFVERSQRDARRIDHLHAILRRPANQLVVQLVRLMMLAVHVQEHTGPDAALLELIEERVNPGGFDEEKIQPGFGAQALDGVDEKIIRVQLVGHHQIIDARHGEDFGRSRRRVNESRQNVGAKITLPCATSDCADTSRSRPSSPVVHRHEQFHVIR